MNLLVIGIGIGHEKDLIIGYRYRFKFFISCIPNNNDKISLAICSLLCYLHTEWETAHIKGVIWCDFKFSFLFGVLQAVRA